MFNITNDTLCVVDTYKVSIYTFCTESSAKEELRKAERSRDNSVATWGKHIQNYPERAEMFRKYLDADRQSTFEIMTFGEFEKLQREKLLAGVPEEITEERFEEMLNVLPPIKWTRRDGVEMFCMSEMWTGSYTNQYAHDHYSGKYYCKMVDCLDESTWIHNYLR